MKFLMNEKTGQIMRTNKVLAKKKNMIPCSPPWEKAKESEYVDIVPKNDDNSTKPTDKDRLLPKDDAAKLVKDWFGVSVDKVKVQDLYEYAKKKTGKDYSVKMTKLQIVTQLAADLKE